MSKDLFNEKVIKKIMEYKPEAVSTIDFMRHVFSTHTRIISAYRSKADLTLPGVKLTEDYLPSNSHPRWRAIKRHTLLWVRCDLVQPNRIEIEHNHSIYIVTRPEWEALKRNLKLQANNEDI
jgi:hypothetical protein